MNRAHHPGFAAGETGIDGWDFHAPRAALAPKHRLLRLCQRFRCRAAIWS
jgi:hypothetical protein